MEEERFLAECGDCFLMEQCLECAQCAAAVCAECQKTFNGEVYCLHCYRTELRKMNDREGENK